MRTALAATALVMATLHGEQIPGRHLPDGTPVELQPRHLISSWRSQHGDPVRLHVARDVIVDGLIVIQAGTPVEGVIVEADSGDIGRRPARLAFVVEETTSVAGERIRLQPAPIEVLRRRAAYLLWAGPESTFAAFVDGGHFVTGQVPQRRARAKALDIFLGTSSNVLRNEDVLKLVEGGVSEEVILVKIQASEPAFNLAAQALIELKQGGVSDRVLVAMIQGSEQR